MNTHLLSLLVLLPVAGAVLVALSGRGSESLQKAIGLAVSGAAFFLSLLLVTGFQDVATLQFVEQRPWIPAWGISYHQDQSAMIEFIWFLLGFIIGTVLTYTYIQYRDMKEAAREAAERERKFQEIIEEYRDDDYA